MDANLAALADNLCLSGGAKGADLQFGMCAGMIGHGVIHWSFDGHRSDAPEQEIVRLTKAQLEEADIALAKAALRTRRNSTPRSMFVRNLLRRNWYQVRDAERVYAVATIDNNGHVSGGTAWAVAMFMDRFEGEPCEIYVYDMSVSQWVTWDGHFWIVIQPPKPHGVYAGVGSRDLMDNGKEAIRALYDYKKGDHEKVLSV